MVTAPFRRSVISSSGHIYGHSQHLPIGFFVEWPHIWSLATFADQIINRVAIYMATGTICQSYIFAQGPCIWPLLLSADRMFCPVALYMATTTFGHAEFAILAIYVAFLTLAPRGLGWYRVNERPRYHFTSLNVHQIVPTCTFARSG
jgi:hypothetical protein